MTADEQPQPQPLEEVLQITEQEPWFRGVGTAYDGLPCEDDDA